MTPKKLKALAQEFGMDAKGLSQESLIRQIQRQEGNFDCFATPAMGECDQDVCRWRGECLDLQATAAAHA